MTTDNAVSYTHLDLTVNKVYSDGTAYVNLAYVNRGDQAVCEGSGVAATITMKAKTDIANVRDAIDLSKVSLYGPDVLNSDPGLQPSDDALVSTTPNSSGAISAKRAIGPNKESIVTVEFDMVTTLAPNETNAIVSLGSSDSNYCLLYTSNMINIIMLDLISSKIDY